MTSKFGGCMEDTGHAMPDKGISANFFPKPHFSIEHEPSDVKQRHKRMGGIKAVVVRFGT